MEDNSVNNSRIAKNTLLLYLRMFLTMAIGLYTSRMVLRILGVSDYGIYNVVGGIISMATFLKMAMVAASQRFISYELGTGDMKSLNRVFCTSVNIHMAIALIALLASETLGLWFVNTQLNIPPDRMVAANWVYQSSILAFIVNVISVPYNSIIVAYEKMSAFAYISILEVSLHLLVVYALLLTSVDRLILYGVLMVCVSVLIRSCYTVYCKRHFEASKYHFCFDKELSLKMFSFAGWSLMGNLGFTTKDQISNVILNIFFGTTVNAARGVGMHVTSIINAFATNFTMAINPQITKQYAMGNLEASRKLVYAGCRYTFYLLTLISIPVLVNVDYILKLWLGEVPEYTAQFLTLSLLAALLYAQSRCVTTAIQATGHIKWFQIGICVIMMSELPVAWFLLENGYPPYSAMWPTIVTYSIAILFRFWVLQYYVRNYSTKEYLLKVVLRCALVFALCYIVCSAIGRSISLTFLSFVFQSSLYLAVVCLIVYFVGINSEEKRWILKKLCLQIEKRLNTK